LHGLMGPLVDFRELNSVCADGQCNVVQTILRISAREALGQMSSVVPYRHVLPLIFFLRVTISKSLAEKNANSRPCCSSGAKHHQLVP
jgi:hypothetical protein